MFKTKRLSNTLKLGSGFLESGQSNAVCWQRDGVGLKSRNIFHAL